MKSTLLTAAILLLTANSAATAGITVYKCVPGPGVTCPSTIVIRRPPSTFVESTNPENEAEQNRKIAELEAARNSKKGDAWQFGFNVGILHVDGTNFTGIASVGYHWQLTLPVEVAFGVGILDGSHTDLLGVYDLRAGVAPGGENFSVAVLGEYMGAGGSDGPKQLSFEGARIEPRYFFSESVGINAFLQLGHGEAALPDRRELDGFAWGTGLGLTLRR